MICESCNVEIPPAWVMCIKQNCCPACGGAIMSEDTKHLLDGIKDALEKMPNDPQGLAGWLLSNYELRKKGSGEPTEFYGVKPAKSSKGLTPFAKNAGIDKIAANSKFANLIQHMNHASEEEEENYVDDGGEYSPEERAAFAASAVAPGGVPSGKMKTPLGPTIVGGAGGEFSPDDAESLNALFNSSLTKDLEGGPEHLKNKIHRQRLEQIAKQRELAASGGIGGIKRSES